MDKAIIDLFLQTKTTKEFLELAEKYCEHIDLGYVIPPIVGDHLDTLDGIAIEDPDPDIYYDPPYVFGDTSTTDK